MSSCDPGRSEAQTITSLDNNVMEVNVAWKAPPSPKEIELQAQAGLDPEGCNFNWCHVCLRNMHLELELHAQTQSTTCTQ